MFSLHLWALLKKNQAWTELHITLELLIQPCVVFHFRCPEGTEIVENCNATTDLRCGLPEQGLVHKHTVLLGLLSLCLQANNSRAVCKTRAWTIVMYLRASVVWSAKYLLKTSSEGVGVTNQINFPLGKSYTCCHFRVAAVGRSLCIVSKFPVSEKLHMEWLFLLLQSSWLLPDWRKPELVLSVLQHPKVAVLFCTLVSPCS